MGRQIGLLGEIIFAVSDRVVETIDKVSWSGSARYATHQRHLTNAITEFTGVDPDKITFEMYLSAALGVDVQGELGKIWSAERKGEALPLTIGEKPYGKFRWVIQNHKIGFKNYDRNGNLTDCAVSLSLLEYIEK